MKKEYVLDLHSVNDLERFISAINTDIHSNVDVAYENQIRDARSFLGVMEISTHPLIVRINSDTASEIARFGEICKGYLWHD